MPNGDGSAARDFFRVEYRMNHALFTYAKPIVAFMDGITMGGGVGISQPAKFRVATENTKLAMPETGIGLFPDVGGGWYLSRLPGRIGQYLALTGHRLDGAECLALGLASHYLHADALEAEHRDDDLAGAGQLLRALVRIHLETLVRRSNDRNGSGSDLQRDGRSPRVDASRQEHPDGSAAA